MIEVMVNIDVADIAPAVRFYTSAFGLRPGRRLGVAAIELVGANAPIFLLAKPPGSAASPAPSDRRAYRRHWTPVHLDFVVDDIDGALARAEAAGAVVESPIDQGMGKNSHDRRPVRQRDLHHPALGSRL